jgi:translation initiation factor 5B
LYNWKGDNKKNVELVLQEQGQNTRNEFDKRCNDVIVQFAEQVKKKIFLNIKNNFLFVFFFKGLNVALYYKNPDQNEFYSMVPTSAHTGDGMGSLIAMLIEKCQTTLAKRLSYTDELQATVMEVSSFLGYSRKKNTYEKIYLFIGKSNWWSWYNN